MSQNTTRDELPGYRPYETFASIPEYQELRAARDADDWGRVESELEGMSAEDVSYAIQMLAEVDGIETFLEGARRDHPESPYAGTALAARHAALAWETRTLARASRMSPEQLATFADQLRRAEQILIRVCAANPSFIPAWTVRLSTARGLELGASEARRRYRHAESAAPADFPTQLQLLQFLLPTWFGDMERAEQFARTSAASARPGSNGGAIIAQFHIERWMQMGTSGPGYLRGPGIQEDLQAAARRSVLHPEHVFSPIAVLAHSVFAMVFWLGGYDADAAVHFRALGPRATSSPWRDAVEGPVALAKARAKVITAAKAEAPT